MRFRFPAILLLAPVLMLSACGGSSSSSTTTATNTTSTSTTTTNTAAKAVNLKSVSSSSDLETYLKSLLLELYGQVRPPNPLIVYATSTTSGSVSDSTSTSKASFSTTTTQEDNVDEADRLKTDGTYLYTTATDKPNLLIFKTNQTTNELVQDLSLDSTNASRLTGLYLYNHKLAVLSDDQQYFGIWARWFMPQYWQNQHSYVHLLDATNPAAIAKTNQLSVDGQLISSRRIGSTLYLATRHSPTLKGLTLYPVTEAEAAANRALINKATLQDFLPHYQWQGGTSQALFQAEDCFLTAYSDKKNYQASIISLVSIDMTSVAPIPQGKCFAGDAETVYASTEAVYLATTQYTYPVMPMMADTATTTNNATTTASGTAITSTEPSINPVITYTEPSINTDIHKFSLTSGAIEYKGSGRVTGHLGWYQDLKPFRMSESEGVLRIFTSVGDTPTSNASPAHLYTLEENSANQTLDIIGQLPNSTRPQALGKTGEQIYATRFLGKRGYLVTFRVTDPLYVVDLSSPTDPYIAGELKIDGYSDYLQPVGDNWLLGIGKDAVVDSSGMGDGRGAWYQGVKLSLIDVSNPSAPYEKQKIIIGKRGTETTVSQTHHALSMLQQGNSLKVALPISLHAGISTSGNVISPAATYYDWTQDELYRLTVDLNSGAMTGLSPVVSEKPSMDNYYPYSWPNDRSVLIGNYVHYLHGDKVFSQEW